MTIINAITLLAPFSLVVAVALVLFRRIVYLIRKKEARVNYGHFSLLLILLYVLYVIYFGRYIVIFEPEFTILSALVASYWLFQSWSYRGYDEKPPINPDSVAVDQAKARKESLDYMRMTAGVVGTRSMRVATLESDVAGIKQRLDYQEELLMEILQEIRKK